MRLTIAAVTPRRGGLRPGPARDLFALYVERLQPYAATELVTADTETALLERALRDPGRVPPHLVLLDSRGKALASEAFAQRIRELRDLGVQRLVFAIGPADGWSDEARAAAHLLLSLGPMTLPHELAMVVCAEQLYRAHTILAGHPYHGGH